jgi:hypothetical protein
MMMVCVGLSRGAVERGKKGSPQDLQRMEARGTHTTSTDRD